MADDTAPSRDGSPLSHPDDAAGRFRETYVVVHGRGGRFEDFQDLAKALAAQGRVLAYDWESGRLVGWHAEGFSERSARSRSACVGASVQAAARSLSTALHGVGGATLVGHSKGGAVVLQALADIAEGAPDPGIKAAVVLDPAISRAAHLGIRLEAALKRRFERLGRISVLAWPFRLYARFFLKHDQLDIQGLRSRIQAISRTGIPVTNIQAQTGWSSPVPGASNVFYAGGGHRDVLDWRLVVDALRNEQRGSREAIVEGYEASISWQRWAPPEDSRARG